MPRVLVADANSNIQRMVTSALKDAGIDVIAVANGEAAVRKMQDVNPDVILADVFMPARTGYEVCEYVKRHARHSHVPVILLVGAFDPFDENEARRVHADGVLRKPFVPPDPLITMVKAFLAKSASEHLGEDTVPVSIGVPSPQGASASRAEPFHGGSHADTSRAPSRAKGTFGAIVTEPLPQFAETDLALPELSATESARTEFAMPTYVTSAPGLPSTAADRDGAASPLLEIPDAQAEPDVLTTSSRDPSLGEPAFWSDASSKITVSPAEEITAEHTWRLDPLSTREDSAVSTIESLGDIDIESAVAPPANGTNGDFEAAQHPFRTATFEPAQFQMAADADADAHVDEGAPHDQFAAFVEGPSQGPVSLSQRELEPAAPLLSPYDDSAATGSTLESTTAPPEAAPPLNEVQEEKDQQPPEMLSEIESGPAGEISATITNAVSDATPSQFATDRASESSAARAVELDEQPEPVSTSESEPQVAAEHEFERQPQPESESGSAVAPEYEAREALYEPVAIRREITEADAQSQIESDADSVMAPSSETQNPDVEPPAVTSEIGDSNRRPDTPITASPGSSTDSGADAMAGRDSQIQSDSGGGTAPSSETPDPGAERPVIMPEVGDSNALADTPMTASPWSSTDSGVDPIAAHDAGPGTPISGARESIHEPTAQNELASSLASSAASAASLTDSRVDAITVHDPISETFASEAGAAIPEHDENDERNEHTSSIASSPTTGLVVAAAWEDCESASPSSTLAFEGTASCESSPDAGTLEMEAVQEPAAATATHTLDAAGTIVVQDDLTATPPAAFEQAPPAGAVESMPNAVPMREPLTPEALETIVTRIVDRMQPKILEALTRDVLRPIIEALVRRELRKH